MRPKESEMIAIIENAWEQIHNHGTLKNNHISKVRAKTALKSFAYSYLDLDIKQFISDSKSIKMLRKLKDKCLILKPDKGQGIVLIIEMITIIHRKIYLMTQVNFSYLIMIQPYKTFQNHKNHTNLHRHIAIY